MIEDVNIMIQDVNLMIQDVNIMIGMIIVIRVVLGVHCPESDKKLTWT